MARIFVSYRRDDAAAEASSIAKALRAHPSQPTLFFDTSEIRPGDPWRKKIDAALADCDTAIVVIGRRWFDVPSGATQPRLLQPDDVVAYEVRSALGRAAVRVVPVLVDGATWAAMPALPPPFDALRDLNGPTLRNDAFDDDLHVFVEKLLGPAAAPPPDRRPLVAAAFALVAVAGLGTWWIARPPPAPAPASTPAQAPAGPALPTHVEVDLRLSPDKKLDDAGLPSDRVELLAMEPVKRSPMLAERSSAPAEMPLQYRFEGLDLPGAGQLFIGRLARAEVRESMQLDADLARATRTPICFKTATPTAAPVPARVRLECTEGDECVPAKDDPGPIVACGSRNGGWLHWLDWLPSAHAQQPPAAGDGPAPGDWLAPSLASLLQRKGGAGAIGFSEVVLESGPLPALAAADEIAYELRINDHRVWVGALPAWARAQPFDPAVGVRLRFGLENLDASGADAGFERLAVRLLFLKNKEPVAEDELALRYVALRTTEPVEVAGRTLRARWHASYCPGPADRYQIFLTSLPGSLVGPAKARIDAAQLKLGGEPLVAVIRPPNPGNPSYGLAVGLQQPNGQVRYSFEDARARALCREIVELQRLRSLGLTPADAYRREIARECGEPASKKPIEWCRSF